MVILKHLLLPSNLPKETLVKSSQILLSISKPANCTHTIEPAQFMSINHSSSFTIPPTSVTSTSPPPKTQTIAVPHGDLAESTISAVPDESKRDVHGESTISVVPDESKRHVLPNPTPATSDWIDRIRREVSVVLEWHRTHKRLSWEDDRRVPAWAQNRVEAQLNLPVHSLDSYKIIVLETVHNYYKVHGKRPLKWILTDR